MNWREQLRPGSFRGVPFLVESSDQQIGRRAVQTEYPGRDEPYAEDMGRRAWADSLTIFVLGQDHLEQAQKLTTALNQYGPGELVHPYQGTLLVQVGDASVRHSSREGGVSTFSISMHEAGPAATPNEQLNTDIALQDSSSAAEASLLEEFKQYFAVEGMTQGLVDELSLSYDTAIETVAPLQDVWAQGQNLWAKGQGVLGVATGFIARGQNWVGRVVGITKIFSNPSALGGALFYGLRNLLGIFGHVGTSGSQGGSNDTAGATQSLIATPATPTAAKILDVLRKLPAVERTRIEPVNMTASRKEQVRMQGALLDLVQGATVIAAAQASSLVQYQDQEQAQEVKSVFIEAIDQVQQRSSDTVYQALERVRVDLVKDLSSRGAGLPSVTRITPTQTLPALVQAYRLYGDSRREEQLVERNQLSHPGFVPAGEPLEVVR